MNKDFIVKNGLQVTDNVYIGGEVSNVSAINFYAGHADDDLSEGHLCWNDDDGTLNLGMAGGNVVLQVGQEALAYVKNTTANTILNGSIVAHTSAQDGRLIIQPFIADGSFLPEEFLGIATENIAPGSLGYVNTFGYVRDIDTSTFNVGDVLYASANTPGGLTTETPVSPNVKVVIGTVTSSSVTGDIFVDKLITPLASDVTYNNATSNLVATNLQAAVDELQLTKASIDLLTSSITLYPTTASSNVATYNRMVTSTTDSNYDDVAVDIATGAISTDDQLLASLIADTNLFIGDPGVLNLTTIGNIAKTAGNKNNFAEFYFMVYKRSVGGTETLIGVSNTTGPVNPDNLNIYQQFSASTVVNTGSFLESDRLVIKYYANAIEGTSSEYDFQFGGSSPVKTLVPVPVSVIPSANASGILVDTSAFNGILSGSDSTVQLALDTIDDHSHSTDEISEGSNLYYTVPRANSAIDARVTQAYINALNVDANTLNNESSAYYLDYDNFTNTPSIPQSGVDFDPVGTDNSTDVTLAGAYDYITISSQQLTLNQIDYATDITNLPTLYSTANANTDIDAHINVSSATANQVLSWTGSDYEWVDQSAGGGGTDYGDSNVDLHLNTASASNNQVLSWTGSDYDWVNQSAGGGGSVTTSNTAPVSPNDGDLWFNTDDTTLAVYYEDVDSGQWVVTSGPQGIPGTDGSNAEVYSGNTAPGSPSPRTLWFNTDDASMYFYYDDATSNQWVAISGPQGPKGDQGEQGPAGADGGVTTGKAIAMAIVFG